jgi:hypothetical protein
LPKKKKFPIYDEDLFEAINDDELNFESMLEDPL